jgi:hypothetical protein
MKTVVIGPTQAAVIAMIQEAGGALNSWAISRRFRYHPEVSQPALWRLFHRGLLKFWAGGSTSRLSPREAEALERAIQEHPTASTFWVIPDSLDQVRLKVRQIHWRSLLNLR